ncbi:NTPase [candidate division WOR-3 bacterium]|nr:NTPase [candidate division WOR-3 bacterium]
MNNILLTGKPGIGKTTLILKVLRNLNCDAIGFYTQEIRKGNTRVGFELFEIGGERKEVFAHIDFDKRYRVGRYGVDISILEEIGMESIKRGIIEKKLIVIDEIGKMELYSKRFKEVVTLALNSSSPVLATITRSSIPFVNDVKQRKDVTILEITRNNRDELLGKIITKLEGSGLQISDLNLFTSK